MPNPLEEQLTGPNGLATRLRALRTQAGLSGMELAHRAGGWAQSKVSRIETGKQLPTFADLATWANACEQDSDVVDELRAELAGAEVIYQDWRRRQRQGQAVVQQGYAEMVRSASSLRYFETVFVPGLLQTRGYARHVMGMLMSDAEPNDLDSATVERLQSQQVLYDSGKTIEFLIAEPVLLWCPCPLDVMRGQLDRLQTIVDLPNVRFGVLPMRRQLSAIPVHGFTLVDEVALIETFTGEITHTGAEAERYAEVMDRLWADAVSGEDARQLIVRAADDMRMHGD